MNVYNTFLKFLNHNIWVHIYSSPNFFMETCMSLLMCIFHCLLIIEVNNMIKELNVRPLKIRVKPSLSDIKSKSSISKNVVKRHPELGVDIMFKDDNSVKSDWDTTTKINKILSTSLSEYLRRDLRRRINGRMAIEGGDDEKPLSEKFENGIEKIYNSILQEPDMQRRLDVTQEEEEEGDKKEHKSEIPTLIH